MEGLNPHTQIKARSEEVNHGADSVRKTFSFAALVLSL